jgi:hypothetical protein
MIVEIGVLLLRTNVASVQENGEAKRLEMTQMLSPVKYLIFRWVYRWANELWNQN